MDFCKTAEFLYEALPLRPIRAWLIRRHMDGCPRCQARLLSREEAQGLLIDPAAVGTSDELWRRILSRAAVPPPEAGCVPTPAGPAWRWAAATVLAAMVALTGFWLLRQVERADVAVFAAADRFEIMYVKVGGEPAQTFVYQAQGTDTVFVWAQRSP